MSGAVATYLKNLPNSPESRSRVKIVAVRPTRVWLALYTVMVMRVTAVVFAARNSASPACTFVRLDGTSVEIAVVANDACQTVLTKVVIRREIWSAVTLARHVMS